MFGAIEFENFTALTDLPPGYKEAWEAVKGLIGVGYKPLLCAGKQLVHGMNYFFIAEQTLSTRTPERHLVKVKVYVLDDEAQKVNIERII